MSNPKSREHLARNASKLSIAELTSQRSWQQSMINHSHEIGDQAMNSRAGEVMDAIDAELLKRGAK